MDQDTIEILKLAFTIGARIAEAAMAAMRAGDTSTLDALRGVLDAPELLRARDIALRESQRAKARRGSKP